MSTRTDTCVEVNMDARVSPAMIITHESICSGLHITDDDVRQHHALRVIGCEIASDIAHLTHIWDMRRTRGTFVKNSFLRSVSKYAQVVNLSTSGKNEITCTLTVAQVRGLLNTVMGNAVRARAMLWSSSTVRMYGRHRGNKNGFGGTDDTDCRVCGKPLTKRDELLRGIGDTCWRKVLTM